MIIPSTVSPAVRWRTLSASNLSHRMSLFIYVFFLLFILSIPTFTTAAFPIISRSSAGYAFLSQNPQNYIDADIVQFSGDAITISLWVKHTLPTQSAPYFLYRLAGQGSSDIPLSLEAFTVDIRLRIFDAYSICSASVQDGKWHHIVVTHSFLAKMASFFIDGSRAGTNSFDTENPLGTTAGRLHLGRPRDEIKFFGMMDDFLLMNMAISPQQVAWLYRFGYTYMSTHSDTSYIASHTLLRLTFDEIYPATTSTQLVDSSPHDSRVVTSFETTGNVIVPSTANITSSSFSAISINMNSVNIISLYSHILNNYTPITSLSELLPPSKPWNNSDHTPVTTFPIPLATDNDYVLCNVSLAQLPPSNVATLYQVTASKTLGAQIVIQSTTDPRGIITNSNGFVAIQVSGSQLMATSMVVTFYYSVGPARQDSCYLPTNGILSRSISIYIYPNSTPRISNLSINSITQSTEHTFRAAYVPNPVVNHDNFVGIDREGDDILVYVLSLPDFGYLSQVDPSSGDLTTVITTTPTLITHPRYYLAFTPDPSRESLPFVQTSFQIVAADSFGNGTIGYVNFTVQTVQTPPVSTNQTISILEDQQVQLTFMFDHVDEDDCAFILITQLPSHGTLYQVVGNNTIGPAINFSSVEMNEVQQWVSHVPAVSSSLHNVSYSYTQLYGPPNVFPAYGDNPLAWSGSGINQDEWIWLHFNTPTYLHSIEIYETYNPGHIIRVSVPYIDLAANATAYRGLAGWTDSAVPTSQDPTLLEPDIWKTIWEASENFTSVPSQSRVFSPVFCQSRFLVQDIILHTSAAINSLVEIDAIRMLGYRNIARNYVQSFSNSIIYQPEYSFNSVDSFRFIINSCLYWNNYRSIGVNERVFTINVTNVKRDPVAHSSVVFLYPPSYSGINSSLVTSTIHALTNVLDVNSPEFRSVQTYSSHASSTTSNNVESASKMHLLSLPYLSNALSAIDNVCQNYVLHPLSRTLKPTNLLPYDSTARSLLQYGDVSANAAGYLQPTTYSILWAKLHATDPDTENLTYIIRSQPRYGSLHSILSITDAPPVGKDAYYYEGKYFQVDVSPISATQGYPIPDFQPYIAYKSSHSCLRFKTATVEDYFTFVATDGELVSNSANITIRIVCSDEYSLKIIPATSFNHGETNPPPTSEFQLFPNRTIMYKGDITSSPAPIGSIVRFTDNLYAVWQYSGSVLYSPPQVVVLDYFGNPITDALQWSALRILVDQSTGAVQLGSQDQSVQNGLANFSTFAIQLLPGTSTTFRFQSSMLFDPITTPVVIFFALPCPAGFFVSNGTNECVLCPAGFTSDEGNSEYSCYPLVKRTGAVEGGVLIGLAVFVIILCIITGIILVIYRRHRIVFSLSPLFLLLTLTGIIMVLISVILLILPVTVNQCYATLWLFNLGFCLTFGSVFAKTYRLYAIFKNYILRAITISNSQLLSMLSAILSFDVIILLLSAILSPFTIEVNIYEECASRYSDVFIALLIASKGILLCWCAYLTYQVHSVPTHYNESRWLALAIYNILMTGAVIMGAYYGLRNMIGHVESTILLAVGILFGATSSFILLFAHVLIKLLLPGAKPAAPFDFNSELAVGGLATRPKHSPPSPRKGRRPSLPLINTSIDFDVLISEMETLKAKPHRHPLEDEIIQVISTVERCFRTMERARAQTKTSLARLGAIANEISYLTHTKQVQDVEVPRYAQGINLPADHATQNVSRSTHHDDDHDRDHGEVHLDVEDPQTQHTSYVPTPSNNTSHPFPNFQQNQLPPHAQFNQDLVNQNESTYVDPNNLTEMTSLASSNTTSLTPEKPKSTFSRIIPSMISSPTSHFTSPRSRVPSPDPTLPAVSVEPVAAGISPPQSATSSPVMLTSPRSLIHLPSPVSSPYSPRKRGSTVN
jgi:hypothetical protein